VRSGARSGRVAPWGIHIGYHDIFQSAELEEKYPNLNFYEDIEQLFRLPDIISIISPWTTARGISSGSACCG